MTPGHVLIWNESDILRYVGWKYGGNGIGSTEQTTCGGRGVIPDTSGANHVLAAGHFKVFTCDVKGGTFLLRCWIL